MAYLQTDVEVARLHTTTTSLLQFKPSISVDGRILSVSNFSQNLTDLD